MFFHLGTSRLWTYILVFAAAYGLFSQGTLYAQSTSIFYDAAQQTYFINGSASFGLGNFDAKVTPGGEVENFDPRFTSFAFFKDGSQSARALRLPIGSGLLSEKNRFYQVQEDGRTSSRLLFDQDLIPCPPPDTCALLQSGEFNGHQLAIYFSAANGFKIVEWKGQTYGEILPEFDGLDFEDMIFLNDALSFMLPLGSRGNSALFRRIYNSDEALVIKLRSPTKKHSLVTIPRTGTALVMINGAWSKQGQLYILLTSQGKSEIYRLSQNQEAEAEVKIENLTAAWGDILGSSAGLGIDASGVAYVLHDGLINAIDLMRSSVQELGSCKLAPAFSQENLSQNLGIWVHCGDQVLGLAQSEIRTEFKLAQKISQGHIVSHVGQDFTALLIAPDGSSVRVDEGRVSKNKGLIAQGVSASQDAALTWYDSRGLCKVREVLEAASSKRVVSCLIGNAWQESESQPIGIPTDIYESLSYTWLLRQDQTSIKIYRRLRDAAAPWKQLGELPLGDAAKTASFFASSVTDEIGILRPGATPYRMSAKGELFELQGNLHVLLPQVKLVRGEGKWQSALGEDQWLYALCQKEGEIMEACSFDKAGHRQTLSPQPAAGMKNGTAVLPLQRGALYVIGSGQGQQYVVHEGRIILLSKLFGELKAPESWEYNLQVWRVSESTVLLHLMTSDSTGSARTTLFRFDGRKLAKEAEAGPDNMITNDRAKLQMWRDHDGLWRRYGLISSELPIISAAEPAHLLSLQLPLPNELGAAAVSGDQLILADQQGFSLCPEAAAASIDEQTLKLPQAKDCQHQHFNGKIRQMAAQGEQQLLLLSGRDLWQFDKMQKTFSLLYRGVDSQRFYFQGNTLTFAHEGSIWQLELDSGALVDRGPLPLSIPSTAVKMLTDHMICAEEGIFGRQDRAQAWVRLAGRCMGAVAEESTGLSFALTPDSLLQCQGAQCTSLAPTPFGELDKLTIGFDRGPRRDLLVTRGRQVYKLEDGQLQNCKMRWAYGELPLADVKGIENGWLVTAGGGAVGQVCEAEQRLFRLD